MSEEIAWLAGLMEGEGHFSLHSTRVQIVIQMTDEDVLQRAARIAGAGNVTGPYQVKTYRPIWRWVVSEAGQVVDVAELVRPWLGQRRQAQLDAMLQGWLDDPVRRRKHVLVAMDRARLLIA